MDSNQVYICISFSEHSHAIELHSNFGLYGIDNHEELGAFFSNDPDFMTDLMKVLQSNNLIPNNMRSTAM